MTTCDGEEGSPAGPSGDSSTAGPGGDLPALSCCLLRVRRSPRIFALSGEAATEDWETEEACGEVAAEAEEEVVRERPRVERVPSGVLGRPEEEERGPGGVGGRLSLAMTAFALGVREEEEADAGVRGRAAPGREAPA